MTAPFVQTASGRAFTFGDYDPDAVLLSDIAAHLAKINRFSGATYLFFSVAQHSCMVAEQLAADPLLALYGLVHDGHEAYLGDTPTPFQRYLAGRSGLDWLGIIKREIDAVIFKGLGLPPITPEQTQAVHDADRRAFATERLYLMKETNHDWGDLAEPLPDPIYTCWPWPKAEEKFIAAWNRYAVLTDVPLAKRRAA